MTGLELVNLAFKRLVSAEDFRERLVGYLSQLIKQYGERMWDGDGVFDALMTITGATGNAFVIGQASPATFKATDGLGNMLSLAEAGDEEEGLGQIKTVVFENGGSVLYYISLQRVARPSGIVINPRTGLPVYDKEVEAIGVRAEPNSVTDNGTTITFVIDSVCEAGHSHAGRKALVFLKSPARGGTLEADAIELCDVSWNGANNRITTTGALGQGSVSTDASLYEVILLGPTVRKADTSAASGHVFLGTITGNGSALVAPPTTSTSGQQLIDKTLTALTGYGGGGDWADGTTNPVSTLEAQLDKIISDLTSSSGAYGAGKITMGARASWFDGTTNPATRLDLAIAKIVTDLASVAGNGGADRIGYAGGTGQLHDGETPPSGSIWDAIQWILDRLGDEATGGLSIGVPLQEAGQRYHPEAPFPTRAAGSLEARLQADLDDIGARVHQVHLDQFALASMVERAALSGVRCAASNGSRNIVVGRSGAGANNLAYSEDGGRTWSTATLPGGRTDNINAIAWDGNNRYVAVGDSGFIAYSTNNGQTWTLAAPDAGYVGDFADVIWASWAGGAGRWYAAGTGGEVQEGLSSADTWTTRPLTGTTGTPDLASIAQKRTSGTTGILIVGGNNEIHKSTDEGANWTGVLDGHNVSRLFYDETRDVFMAAIGATTQYSDDDGDTWQAGVSSILWEVSPTGLIVALSSSTGYTTANAPDSGPTQTKVVLPESGHLMVARLEFCWLAATATHVWTSPYHQL